MLPMPLSQRSRVFPLVVAHSSTIFLALVDMMCCAKESLHNMKVARYQSIEIIVSV